MLYAITTGVTAVLLYVIFAQLFALRLNLVAAKRSGLPYSISPVGIWQPLWLMVQKSVVPLLQRLPVAWTETWLPLAVLSRIWEHGYDPFLLKGADTFIIVSPFSNTLWTCEPEAVVQISKRRGDFPKPPQTQMLDIYGPTLAAAEGEEWRTLRRATGPYFNEELHAYVWKYALSRSGSLLEVWGALQSSNVIVPRLQRDMEQLMLHIISETMFGYECEWPSKTGTPAKLPANHELSYSAAVASLLRNIYTLFLSPRVVLGELMPSLDVVPKLISEDYSPFEVHKSAKLAFYEWAKYMGEMKATTEQLMADGVPPARVTLLDVLVRAQQGTAQGAKTAGEDKPIITERAVVANIFQFVLAGHETSSNTITFAITVLACLPDVQRRVQQELDSILGNRPIEQWSYERDMPKLFDGYTGAVLNETLRLWPPLPAIPKSTTAQPQSLTLNGRTYLVPGRADVFLNAAAAHRSPKHWQSTNSEQDSSKHSGKSPLSEFDPSRWLADKSDAENSSSHRVEGAFFPFSEGARNCIGKRMAQVELVAIVARIFKFWNVGLFAANKDIVEVRRAAVQKLADGVEMGIALKLVDGAAITLSKRS